MVDVLTYQIAHDDFGVSSASGRSIGRCGFGSAFGSLCILLYSSNRGTSRDFGGSGGNAATSTSSTTAAWAAAQNIIERLIKLSRHDDDILVRMIFEKCCCLKLMAERSNVD